MTNNKHFYFNNFDNCAPLDLRSMQLHRSNMPCYGHVFDLEYEDQDTISLKFYFLIRLLLDLQTVAKKKFLGTAGTE